MASTRPISLEAWDISREEYRELEYFCLQYAQKKRAAAALTLPGVDGAARARRERLLRDVRMIESAARLAADDLAPWVLSAVTSRRGVQALFACDRPPVGERQFYALRRRFFRVLSGLRNGESGDEGTGNV